MSWDTRERIRFGRSTLLDQHFAIRTCERGSESGYLYLDRTQEHYDSFADDTGENRRPRFLYRDREEGFRESPDQGYENGLSFEKHDSHRYRSTGSRLHHEAYAHSDEFFEDVRYVEREESRRVNNVICKFFAEGYCKKGEDCNFSHQDDYRTDGRVMDGYQSMERTCGRIDPDVSFRWSESRREYQDDYWDHGGFIERDELEERTYDRSDLDVSLRGRSETRRVNNIPCKFFAEGYCKRGEDCSFSHHEDTYNDGRFMEGYEAKERTYDRSDLDASFQQISEDLPCKYFAKGYCKRGEDCSFSHQEPLGRSSDRKWGSEVDTGRLPWKSPMRGDQRTGGRYDHGKQRCYNSEGENNLSWNFPKNEENRNPNWGKRRKIVGSLDSSLRWLDDDQSDYNGKFSRFSRNGWEGNQAPAMGATNYGKGGNSMRVASTSSWDGPKWGDRNVAREAPNSPKWDSDVKFDNEPLWNGPNFSRQGLDADPWDNKARSNHVSSCNDSKWGGKVTKDASWNDSNWGEQRKIESRANSLKWGKQKKLDDSSQKGYNTEGNKRFSHNGANGRAQNSRKWGTNVRTDGTSSWNGPKWGNQATKESSWNGRKWGDQATKESSWKGPKCSDHTKGTSWDSWGDKTKEKTHAVKISQGITNDDKWNNSVKNGNCVSWDGPKWGEQDVSKEGDQTNAKDELVTKDSSGTCQWRSGNGQCGSNNETDPVAKKDASDSSMRRSDDAGSRASTCDSGEIKSSLDVCQQKSSLGTSEEALFSREQNLQNLTREESGIDRQDTIPQPIPSQQERQNDQMIEKSEQPHVPVILKSPVAAANPVQPDNSNPKANVHISVDKFEEVSKVGTGETKNVPRNAHPEGADSRLKVGGDCERIKEEVGIRMLKFALVEFVKDILKPYWQDGRLTKEDHKLVVKKVVDKVTGTLPAHVIPRSQENVDQYMSFSKTKITELVMAYLEIYSKKS